MRLSQVLLCRPKDKRRERITVETLDQYRICFMHLILTQTWNDAEDGQRRLCGGKFMTVTQSSMHMKNKVVARTSAPAHLSETCIYS